MTSSFYATLTSGGSGQRLISQWQQQQSDATQPLLTSVAAGSERYSTGSDDVSVWAVTSPRYQFRKSNSMKLALRELDEGKAENLKRHLNFVEFSSSLFKSRLAVISSTIFCIGKRSEVVSLKLSVTQMNIDIFWSNIIASFSVHACAHLTSSLHNSLSLDE